nr:hypothetical protein [uncultured Flavobacterium sp.]
MFTFMAVVGFSFTSSAQCGEQATQVCGTCYTVQIPWTGSLLADSLNAFLSGGTMLRKPTIAELEDIMAENC